MKKAPKTVKKDNFERRFYNLTDSKGRPVVTVCVMSNKTRTRFSRGLSICSPDSNPTNKEGRDKACGRATQALVNHMTTGVIRREEALEQLRNVGAFGKKTNKITECKSSYFESTKGLTQDEIRLIEVAV
jgi:hypothetical protein